MRLIDADNLNFQEQHYNKSQMKAILDFVDAQPTTYDVDKVVKQLKELRELDACDFDNCPDEDINCCDCTQKRMAERAIEIVKAGGNY